MFNRFLLATGPQQSHTEVVGGGHAVGLVVERRLEEGDRLGVPSVLDVNLPEVHRRTGIARVDLTDAFEESNRVHVSVLLARD